jgi:hypothetical protein
MTLNQFKDACNLSALLEIDKVCYLAFFYFKTEKISEFSPSDASKWLTSLGFAAPNQARLQGNLRAAKSTIKGQHGWRLRLDFVEALDAKFPALSERSQEVLDLGTVLPEVDYEHTRGYIESLAKQINASYEHNIFDGCAVLMRRLVEIVLILSYRKLNLEAAIRDNSGNYLLLEGIINDAKTNNVLSLSRNSKGSLDIFRQLGNFSAHKIEYIGRREYIKPHLQDYRALIVELLHKSGLRT